MQTYADTMVSAGIMSQENGTWADIEKRKDKKNEPNVRQERRRTRIIC